MKPRLLVCDDNKLQRQNLIDFLNELKIPMNIDESKNGEEILSKVHNKKFDIIITDIILGNSNIIETIKKIRALYPYVYIVFVTAYKNYVMEAVTECHCYDYISKPVNKERFQDTMNLILKKFTEQDSSSNTKDNEKNLIVNYNNESFIIPTYKILFIEQQGYLSIIHTNERTYQCVSTLVHLYNQLDDSFFLTHKSFLVNIKNVAHVSYNRKSSSDIFFYNYDLPALLSIRKKSEFKKILQKYSL